MKNTWYSLSSFSFLAIGIVLAVFGVAKPDHSFAAASKVGSNTTPVFGNTSSNVQVYIVTDWFCPACRQIESKVLYNLYPEIMKKATLIFVDRAIHEDSLNFTPYNLSFMINQKDKYFQIRKALHDLSEETRNPTDAQISKAVAPLGVTYKRLQYADVNSGIQYFDGIAKEFKIDSTPTVIITNRRKLDAKVLVGGGEITADNVMNMINELAHK